VDMSWLPRFLSWAVIGGSGGFCVCGFVCVWVFVGCWVVVSVFEVLEISRCFVRFGLSVCCLWLVGCFACLVGSRMLVCRFK